MTPSPQLVLPVGPRDHVLGPPKARVTLVEYGDYECPHCGRAHVILKELLKRVGDRVRLVFRNFPLATMHPHAEHAAEAAEAAGAQGAFRKMHDLLFENQEALEDDDLAQYAAALGLDLVRFRIELEDHAHAERVREDFMSGVRSGVNGTPTFFVDGVRHDGPFDLESLLLAIETAEGATGKKAREGRLNA